MAFNLPLPTMDEISIPHQLGVLNALQKQSLENRFYAPNIQSQIGYRNALTQGQDITNQYLPDKLRLANEHQGQLNQLYPSLTESQIATANFKREHPLLFVPGTAGQIGAEMYLNNDANTNKNYITQLQNALNTSNLSKNARAGYDLSRTKGYSFAQMPVDYKIGILAQASGLGYSPEEASKRLINGETIADLAKEKGFNDPNNLPTPIYALTGSGRTKLQQRQQALAELNSVEHEITSAIKPFSRRIFGMSPKQVVQSISGEDEEQQAKFLAAKGLQPELAAIRLRMTNANVGIEAIREMVNAAMGHIKTYQPLVSGEVYEKTNQYISQWLNKMSQAANKQASTIKGNPNAKSNNTDLGQLSDEELQRIANGQ